MCKKRILIINGPNMNLLEKREKEIYSSLSLKEIKALTEKKVAHLSLKLEWFESNIEGEIVGKIQESSLSSLDLLIINPAAYTHTSVAILDALKMLKCPIYEVHLGNVHKREVFRQIRLSSQVATLIFEGAKEKTYYLAISSFFLLNSNTKSKNKVKNNTKRI